MKFKVNLVFRRFDDKDEKKDSGYYDSFDKHQKSCVDVNLDDVPFEQALTIYHEITHMLFDLFSRYEIDDKNQQVLARDNKLREDWRRYNTKIEKSRKDELSREELICYKVEKVVKEVLEKEIPKKFFDRMFTSHKKSCTIRKKRKKSHRKRR